MRVITLEEHYQAPTVAAAISAAGMEGPAIGAHRDLLEDVGEGRIADMDAAGIDLQIMSQGGGIEDLPEHQVVPLARVANDYLAEAVAHHPDRLAGFASLPMASPAAAARELERAVTELGLKGALINGHVHGRFFDDPDFRPVFAAAQRLGVPIYLHPRLPPAAVREAYYSGLDPTVGRELSVGGWGWHVDTGLHALRIVLGGVFDEFPDLSLILGHMGEAIPFLLARSSRILSGPARLAHPVDYYFSKNVYYTTSGLFSDPPLRCLLSVVGVERVMFSIDYPFSKNADGVRFLEGADISAQEREQIAHANAERLLGLAPRRRQ